MNISLDWEELLKQLLPTIISKYTNNLKKITSKKIWEKLKEVL